MSVQKVSRFEIANIFTKKSFYKIELDLRCYFLYSDQYLFTNICKGWSKLYDDNKKRRRGGRKGLHKKQLHPNLHLLLFSLSVFSRKQL